jgi:Ser/Thr protein kinase RdoA (MazF antagonist)
MCRALTSFNHPAANHFMPWDISNGLIGSDQLWAYAAPDLARAAEGAGTYITEQVIPSMGRLRRQVIHNDSHRGNLIRPDEGSLAVTGLIDFGDMVRAPLVQDLAVSVASFMRVNPDPIQVLVAMAEGFDSVVPLLAQELLALHGLVLARLVLAGLLYDFMIAECPTHIEYSTSDRPDVLTQMHRWLSIGPELVTERLESAVNEARKGDRR